ncbi:ABC-2 family transporter protein [Stieleria neptunia]|uniref:ABC-2 family transporter protein n=1 Tax=Stieleria neptunia TaxID=2527979 RepID=A0A518HS41_9BACT|nr:ABC transporter permease subunit [Stieleria neptunia]QDV43662.1 ABC-2 family transporter protein [Stieleria neptunia]
MSSAFNPVVQREFFGIVRSPKAFATLLALTVTFSIAVLMRWPTDATVDLSGVQSIQVFRVFGYGLLAGVVFLVPAFPATSIVNEKNAGTLALLLNSPLSPLSIYFGKLAGVLLFALLVLLASMPGAAACYAMGGIDLRSGLGLFYFVLLVLVFQYATLGMLISSYVQSTDAGVRLTYSIIFALFFLTLVPDAFFPGGSGVMGTVAQWARYLSPVPVVMQIMGQGGLGSRGLIASPGNVQFIVVTLVSSLIFAAVTISRLNYRIFDQSRAQGVITDERGLVTRLLRRFLFIVDPQRRKPGIPWYLNPVMVKEFRCRRFGRSQWLFRLVALCAVVSMVLTFAAATSVTSWGTETIGGLVVILQVILIVVMTPSLTSGLISGERDGGGWELLRLTPLTSLKIVRGKLLSVLWTLLLVLMATLPGYLVMIYIEPQMWYQVNLVLVCLAWTVVYTVAVSAAVGSLFRTTAVATTVTYVVVMALFLVPLLVWLGRGAPFGFEMVQRVLLVNPVGAALSVIETPGFENYNLLPAAWYISGGFSALMFLVFGLKVWRLTRPV